MKYFVENLGCGKFSLWCHAVLAGLLACSPAIALADSKKTRDETKQEKSAREEKNNSTPKFGTNRADERNGSRTSGKQLEQSARQNESKATNIVGAKVPSTRVETIQPAPDLTVRGKGKGKNVSPGDLRGLNPQPNPPGKALDAAKNLKPQKPSKDSPKLDPGLQANGKTKVPKPADLKGLNPQPEPPKNLNGKGLAKGMGKKTIGKDAKIDPAVKLNSGKFDKLAKSDLGKKLQLDKQFDLIKSGKGDVALKLGLHKKFGHHGGWANHHLSGLLSVNFGVGCAPITYCGPGYFPSHCLYPNWSGWVSWSWGFHCDPWFDPRPWFCRPWVYDPCPVWVCWDYPVWVSLPVVSCGTWIDVEPLVIDAGLDLQLLAVRFVDPGHPDEKLGPRFRVWVRNNSPATIAAPFNVMLMAANSRDAIAGLPQAGVRVTRMEPGETQALDIRLPFDASRMGIDADGRPAPFSQLHVLVDSHRELPEAFEANNGAVIARGDILPVDPVIFSADASVAPAGAEINLAGEGFGPEPGQVVVQLGTLELQAEITGWYDLGVRIKLPSLALAGATEAEILIVRGDTAVSNPLAIEITTPVAAR